MYVWPIDLVQGDCCKVVGDYVVVGSVMVFLGAREFDTGGVRWRFGWFEFYAYRSCEWVMV